VKAPLETIAGWVAFAGSVLVVAVLYWGQAVLVPVALAALLAFLLAPAANALERWMGRVAAVLVIVAVASAAFGLAGWALFHQASSMVDELPQYRSNIRHKVADVRWVGRGGTVEKLQQTMNDIKEEVTGSDPSPGAASKPLVVSSEQVNDLWGLRAWIGPILAPLATAGLVVVLVIFMLIERQQLRDRVLVLFGSGTLAVTTRALDEAARRVSRYLFMQSLVNVIFGLGVALGLTLIGVPYALLWGVLASALRFIPYVGPWIGAGTPLLVALAALPGWTPWILVLGLFLVLELFTNLVLETYLYAEAAGVSQVALLVAVAFWAWLWGALGLLLATPLTVCLVVLGKHLPGLEALATVLADEPALDPAVSCYQRLLARDYGDAATLVEDHVRDREAWAETVFDELLLPSLNYVERDRVEQRLTVADEREVIAATRELVGDTVASVREHCPAIATEGTRREHILGFAMEADADELALEMLAALLDATPLALDPAPPRLLPSELVTLLSESHYRVLCIADLPPSGASKARYLVRKLRTALPELTIVVGRWAPPELADESTQDLLAAGAQEVTRTLLETRTALLRLVAARPDPAGELRASGDRAGRA